MVGVARQYVQLELPAFALACLMLMPHSEKRHQQIKVSRERLPWGCRRHGRSPPVRRLERLRHLPAPVQRRIGAGGAEGLRGSPRARTAAWWGGQGAGGVGPQGRVAAVSEDERDGEEGASLTEAGGRSGSGGSRFLCVACGVGGEGPRPFVPVTRSQWDGTFGTLRSRVPGGDKPVVRGPYEQTHVFVCCLFCSVHFPRRHLLVADLVLFWLFTNSSVAACQSFGI